jgi:hypothetical protein
LGPGWVGSKNVENGQSFHNGRILHKQKFCNGQIKAVAKNVPSHDFFSISVFVSCDKAG